MERFAEDGVQLNVWQGHQGARPGERSVWAESCFGSSFGGPGCVWWFFMVFLGQKIM